MIDLHIHSIFSDGELIPSEVVSRAIDAGYTHLAITDHVDPSNIDSVIERMAAVCADLRGVVRARVYPGVEITHVPPRLIGPLAERGRAGGAAVVIVHGETIVEPVPRGTNRAAILAGVDILAHPGLISEEEARLARRKGVLLEISARRGHSLANGHVASLAKKTGARLVYNTDSHAPGDFTPWEAALRIIRGAGLSERDARAMQENARALVEGDRKKG
ncbi:MAG: histidinol phosphate phosphatase domain-containing protein [Deltaproteobacteria bacterium]|nr:histidinol phosphate phosphatase domain-containing protein [Deltaproteobacteria bacterium]